MCCTSFAALSLCLPNLYNSFSPSFVSNLAYKSSYAHPFATAFFAHLFYYFYLLFYPMLSSPFSFLLCSPVLPHSTTMSPYLLFISQISLPAQSQLFFFFIFPLFCPTHQVAHPHLQNPGPSSLSASRQLVSFSFHHLSLALLTLPFSFSL